MVQKRNVLIVTGKGILLQTPTDTKRFKSYYNKTVRSRKNAQITTQTLRMRRHRKTLRKQERCGTKQLKTL